MDDEETSTKDVRQILGMALRHRFIMLTTFLTVVIGSGLFTWLSRPVYESTALMEVTSSSKAGASSEDSIASVYMNSRSLQTQLSLLTKSAEIRQGAISRLSTQDRAAVAEFSAPRVEMEGDTNIVDISAQSYSPTAAAGLANAIADEYIQRSEQGNRAQVRRATKYVADQLKDVRTRLDAARNALKTYKEKSGTVDLTLETGQRVGRLTSAGEDLQKTRADRLSGESQLSRLRGELARVGPRGSVPGSIVPSPVAQTIKGDLTRLELQRLALLQEYQPTSARVQKVEGQIAATRARLRQEAQTVIGSFKPNPIVEAVSANIATTQAQIWSLQAREQALQNEISNARSQVAELPNQEFQLSRLSTEIATLQQTYQALNSKYQNLRVSEEGQGANAQIVSRANTPGAPIRPNKSRNMVMAVVAGLMLALCFAALAEWMDDRVHSEEDATNATRLPVLAEIPFIKETAGQTLLATSTKTSPLLEGYRMLRANIAFAGVDEPIRSVLITSSQPNEGKSTSAVNLAVVMALSGKRVILVDCDLRRPSVHRQLGLSNKVGFTSVVAGRMPLNEALQSTSVPGLQVLTSGRIPPNPPELLDSRAGRACLQQIIDQADFVVFDTPPALALADAQIVATIADAALLVVSFKEAGKREITRTTELLAQTGIKMLGTILNKLSDEIGGYYGSYKYRYYSTYLNPDVDQDEETENESDLGEDERRPLAELGVPNRVDN